MNTEFIRKRFVFFVYFQVKVNGGVFMQTVEKS